MDQNAFYNPNKEYIDYILTLREEEEREKSSINEKYNRSLAE